MTKLKLPFPSEREKLTSPHFLLNRLARRFDRSVLLSVACGVLTTGKQPEDRKEKRDHYVSCHKLPELILPIRGKIVTVPNFALGYHNQFDAIDSEPLHTWSKIFTNAR